MGFRITFSDNNVAEEGHNIYRSDTPMDTQNMPAPIATVGADVTEWDDGTVTPGNTYYYRVGAFTAGGSVELLSEEFEAEAVELQYPADYSLYYDFNNVSGGVVPDVSGGGNNAEVYGSPTIVTGPDGSPALQFSGNNQWLKPALPALPSQEDFTVSCFVNVPSGISGASSTADDILFCQREGSGTNFLLYSMTSYGDASSSVRLLFGGQSMLGPDLRGTGWRHLALRRTGGVLDLFVDAALVDSDSTRTNLLISDASFYIGRSNNGLYYRGGIDEFLVFDRSLSEVELELLRQKGAGV